MHAKRYIIHYVMNQNASYEFFLILFALADINIVKSDTYVYTVQNLLIENFAKICIPCLHVFCKPGMYACSYVYISLLKSLHAGLRYVP